MISWNLNSVLFQICNGHWMPIGKGFESKQPPKISAPNTEEPTLNPRNTAKELWINTPWGTFSPMVGQPGQKDVGRKGKLHRSGHQDHQAPGIKHKKCLKPLAKITRSEILQKQHMCETSATVYIYIYQTNQSCWHLCSYKKPISLEICVLLSASKAPANCSWPSGPSFWGLKGQWLSITSDM